MGSVDPHRAHGHWNGPEVSNGTGFEGQYPDEVAAMYESIATTPDDLLLCFDHVNYTHCFHSCKTVIQHFYDPHYTGAATAQTLFTQWNR